MDTLNSWREIIEKVLRSYVAISYANGEIENELIFDRTSDHYLVMSLGWQHVRRIHGCLILILILSTAWSGYKETELRTG